MASLFRVSICGEGIGGLMLALVLGKYGHHAVDIFEAGPTITTVGAGISIFGRTMDIMKALDLYDDVVKMAIRPPMANTGPTFRKSDQPDGYQWFSIQLQRGSLHVHRKDLVAFLLRQVQHAACNVHTSKRLTSYDVHPDTGAITLHFPDGSHAVTDVLVGADGIRSATRKTMYQNLAAAAQDDDARKALLAHIDPVWSGSLVYRSLVPATKLGAYPGAQVPRTLTLYLGKDKHIVAYPVSQGRQVNVAIFRHNVDAFGSPFEGRSVMDVPKQEIMDHFEDWEVHSRALVKCIERPSRWAIHTLRPLPRYVDGKVALLGDAAHAMGPHFGAGAGLAIEDAFVLGRLLTHACTHRGNVGDALAVYQDVCLPFANGILERAHDVGRCYGFYGVSVEGVEARARVRRAIEDA